MVGLLPWQTIQEIVRHIDFIYNSSVDIIKTRKATLQASKEEMDGQVGRGKDILSTLCQIPHYLSFASSTDKKTIVRANEQADAHDKLSDEEVVAQVS